MSSITSWFPGCTSKLSPTAWAAHVVSPATSDSRLSAQRLLALGLRHDTIRFFLSGLLVLKIKASDPQPALAYVLENNLSAVAELGDGQRVRIRFRSALDEEFDTAWKLPGKRSPPDKNFSPSAVVRLDIGQIRREVFAPQ